MNLASPKLGGKQNAFVLLPSGHGGSRTLLSPLLHFTTKRRDFSRIMSFDSFSGLPRLGNQAQGWTNTLSLTRGQRVSGSHKPRPSMKDRRVTSSAHPSGRHGRHCPCGQLAEQRGHSSRAARAWHHHAELPRRPAGRRPPSDLQRDPQGFTPSPPQLRRKKELTSLSNHAFVRSMTWAWCHSRHLPEKLASSTKAFIIITLIIKKCNNILE